jgi:hypothetical protein
MKLAENPLRYRVNRLLMAEAVDMKMIEEDAARKAWGVLAEKMPDCVKCHHVKASRTILVDVDAVEMSLSCALGKNPVCPSMTKRPLAATGVNWGELAKPYVDSLTGNSAFRDEMMSSFRGVVDTYANSTASSSHIRGRSADMVIFDEAASFDKDSYERPFISPNKDLPKTVVSEDAW